MKKVLSALAIFLIMCSFNVYANAFSDVTENHSWAMEAIDYLYDKMLVSGYPDGTFRPDANIKNSEMAKLITLIFGISENEGTYDDVLEDSWYYDHAKYSKDYFIRENKFYPEEYSKRKEIAYAIYIASKMYVNDSEYSEELTADNKYELAVSAVHKKGIIEGYPDGTLKPDNNVTRAEFAVMIKRMLDIDKEETSEELPVETPDVEFEDVPETETSKAYTSQNYFFVVTEVSEALDENNEVCKKIGGYNNGEYEELYIYDDVKMYRSKDIKVNDVLYIFKDYYGKAKSVSVLTNASSLTDVGNLTMITYNGKNTLAYGCAERIVNDKVLEISASSSGGTGVVITESYRIDDNANFYIYENDEIKESRIGKIRDKSLGLAADFVLCHIEDDIIKNVLIIKK